MTPRSGTRRREHGVALVTTVIVVAVLAVVAVAMMQSTTVDRFSSRSVANYTRAKLAAESALALVGQQLLTNTTNDTFIVVANSFPEISTNSGGAVVANGQLFVGNGVAGSSNFSYVPLFSATNSLTSSVAPVVTNAMPRILLSAPVPGATSPPVTTVFTNQLPGGFRVASPVVSWVYLTNTNGTTNARFAYWVEDLGGKLDLSVVGTNTGDPVARRPTGTNPAEIALWAALTNVRSADASGQAGDDLVTARSNLITAATARIASSNVTTNTGFMAEVAANLRSETNVPDLIPFGFGYADAGRPKYSLNTNISASAVNVLANIIANNLPEFAQRAGGFTNFAGGGATNSNAYSGTSYLQTLAANMIDYADTDSSPTTDGTPLGTNRSRPVFRGVDSYPFITEINKRYVWTSNYLTNIGGTAGRAVFVETTDFVEVWNPSTQPTQPGTLTFVAVHAQSNNFGFLSSSFATPTWASNRAGGVSNGTTTNQLNVSALQPNAFQVLACSPVTNFFFVASPAAITAQIQQEIVSASYHVAWNGTFVDAALGGMLRNAGNMTLNTAINRSQLPSFIYRSGGGFGDPAVGDPRATIYLSRVLDANAYAGNSTFGGRNRRAGSVTPGNSYYEVSPRSWPDAGHDSPPGNAPGSDAVAPTNVAPAAYSNLPPTRIANTGSFASITELGAIFDPIQWRDSSLGAWQGKWTNLSINATADNGYGGGNTLRIGRAEHPRFVRDGLRAAQLMDLFAVGPTNGAGMVILRNEGLININTAGSNALRALAAGVLHNSDPALQPGGTNFFIPTNAVGAFVQGVRDFRSSRPFRAASELPAVSSSTNLSVQWPANAVFGNSNAGAAIVSAWNDAAAEEWFGKIHALSTVRSRNFMIHAIGQSLATNDPRVALSSYQLSKQIYLAPIRNPTNGAITNMRIETIQTWGL